MPLRHSLLRVEVPALQSVDTSRVEDLFQMWSLFSKASHAVEDGKRLENLSWRLWNRETFCCHRKRQSRSPASPSIPPGTPHAAATDIPMPELSSSLESTSSEDFEEMERVNSRPTVTNLPQARPELRYADKGNEKHITPTDLEKFVITIQQTKDLEQRPIDLPLSTPAILPEAQDHATQAFASLMLDSPDATEQSSDTTAQPSSVTDSQANILESSASTVGTNEAKASPNYSASEGSSNTEMSGHSIIRGFTPGGAPSSYRSQTSLSVQPTPILRTLPHKQEARSKKKGAMFTIGTSSGEDESSLESHMYKSALSESLRRPGAMTSAAGSKKQTSFKDEVAIGRAAEHSPVFESDDEDDEVSESAIEDDDDSSDWEDSEDQSTHSSMREQGLFQRVDSRPNLTSRRSLLTTALHEPDRAKALANAASRSTPAMRRSRTTSPNGPSVAASPEQGVQVGGPQPEATQAKPIIMTTSNTHHQLALSPRSTRRNMLSTELTESLRKNLLWERQHKSTGNLAALKRRHTSNDVKNLKQQPEPAPILSQDRTKTFNNDYFHAGLQEYHAKGW